MPTLLTTSEYWSVTDAAGVDIPLSTPAWNLATWGEDRQAPPEYRGDNIVIPFIPGESYVPKVANSQVKQLYGWVIGESDTGVAVSSSQKKQRMHDNWAKVRALFARQGQFTITKRWVDSTGVMRTATALAEFMGGLKPTPFGPSGLRFTVDIKLADPYFYGPSVNIAFNTGTGTYNPTILGDVSTRKISIAATIGGSAVTNPRIDVSTTNPACYWYLSRVMGGATTFTVDFDDQIALATAVNLAPNVIHSGFVEWLEINPGAATIVFSSSANSWSGTLTYVPTYW